MAQQVVDKEAMHVEPTGEEQPENLLLPKSPVHENDIPKTDAAEMEMVDINLPFLYFNV